MKRLEQIKINMRLSLIIKTFLLLVLFSTNAFSQGAPTTMGKEFWVSFGNNAGYEHNETGEREIRLQVQIVASKATSGTLTFTHNDLSVPFSIPAGEVYTYDMTVAEKEMVYRNIARGASAAITDYKSLYINTNEDVSVYAINLSAFTTDATNILPVTNYGILYYTLSYMPVQNNSDGYLVIANENNTEVKVDGTTVATLNRGQVYYRNQGNSDLTGSRVSADKPIALFSTNQSARVPIDRTAADCLFQQQAPVRSWGTKFLVPATHHGEVRIRVLASQDGTKFTYTGGLMAPAPGNALSLNLNAGQFTELDLYENAASYIESNNPVAVNVFMVGGGWVGDPSQAWVPSIEQFLDKTTIAPFYAMGSSVLLNDQHYVQIITPTATKNNTTIAIGTGSYQSVSTTWRDHSSGYSFTTVNLTQNAAYHITNPAGFSAMAYGLGETESYYYLAGAAARQLSAAFYINDVHYQDANGTSICNNSLSFRAEVNFTMSTAPGHIRWYVNNQEVAVQDQLQWTIPSLPVGTYPIKMVVISDGGETVEAVSTVTITSGITPGSIGSAQSIASGATPAELTSITSASGGVGMITYQWQSSTNGTSWSNISGATGFNYAPGALTATTYYRRRATNECGTVETASVQITVAASSNVITANGVEICSGEVAALSASASSITSPVFRWYNAATGGTLLQTGATYNVSPSSTVTYHVSVSGSGQGESSRKAVTVTVKPAATPDMIKITQ